MKKIIYIIAMLPLFLVSPFSVAYAQMLTVTGFNAETKVVTWESESVSCNEIFNISIGANAGAGNFSSGNCISDYQAVFPNFEVTPNDMAIISLGFYCPAGECDTTSEPFLVWSE